MKNGYSERKVSGGDLFINKFIRLVLEVRGSKRIFSNSDTARAYLKKVKCKNYRLSVKGCRRSAVEISSLGDTLFAEFEPKSKAAAKTQVLYLHGGAFVRHMNPLHIKLVDRLCGESGARIVIPAYLTAPNFTCRESLGRIADIYERMLEKSDDIILMGDSCGGGMCVNLLTFLAERDLPAPKKIIMFSPLLDLRLKGDSETERFSKDDPMFGGTDGIQLCVDAWRGEYKANDPHFDPFGTDFGSLPPTYIFTSGGDMLHVGCERFYKKAAESAECIHIIKYNAMFHDFVLYPLSCSADCLKEAAKLIVGECSAVLK